ncbi:MAG: magnesium/cobalt transporter CorA [Calditrichaeota bacterium]|nr:magnesium/cobalt transporter CorA [Calditrichota bacterium]
MLKKIIRRRLKQPGLPPGTMIYTGETVLEKVQLSKLEYDEDRLEFRDLGTIEQAFPFKELPTVTWLNISGLHETAMMEKIGEKRDIHPLILEDILNTDQRPKVEIYDNYIIIILKMLYHNTEKTEIESEQISIVLGENYVITFQEKAGDVLDPVRERIRNPKSLFRKKGADYLAYAIMDVIIDHYFVVLEALGEKIENLEQAVLGEPTQKLAKEIQFMKRELIYLRKSIWPLREVISELLRTESEFMAEDLAPFLKDVYDHTIQVVDTIETFRDMLSGTLDIYLSSVSNRMNEVMKILTIIATIFIPLTFIAGIYGMNFDFMPELHWKWGYPLIWLIMLGIFSGMILFFRRKKWL